MSAHQDSHELILSKRGQYAYQYYDFLNESFVRVSKNSFDSELNPEGIVNFGTAVNCLMEKELEERLRRQDVFSFSSKEHQHYSQFIGRPVVKRALANFFNRYFNVAEPIREEDMVVTSGVSSCFDILAHILFDPDDIVLTPTPTYLGIVVDCNSRSLAKCIELELPEKSEKDGVSFQLTSELLEKKILKVAEEGKMVKGFILISPQNPLGDVYSPELLKKLLEVCAKYKIHAIVDEAYMLTLCSAVTTTSVMSLPDIPDPQRTHVIWSLSKDFGLPGIRFGVLWTKSFVVRSSLGKFSYYIGCSSIIQDAVASILSDFKWLDEVYFPTSRARLQENYSSTAERLKNIGAVVRPSQAGFFVWFHLKKFLREQTPKGELELFEEFFDAGLYIVPGTKLLCSTPGWFRMVFALPQLNIDKGLEIMSDVLKRRGNIGNP